MEWAIYASAVVLHIWAAIVVISLYQLIQYVIIRPNADLEIYPARVFPPFIGLIFFYSWVFFG